MLMRKRLDFIDLFAGCGGLSLGLEQAGFTPILVNEIVPQFSETYRQNRDLPQDAFYVGDICQLNTEFKGHTKFDGITLVCGGPPCQGFSMANRQRIIDDQGTCYTRNTLNSFVLFVPSFS